MKWKPHHKMKRPPDESTHKHKDMETLYILMIILVFLDLKRVNVCEHAIKMACVQIHLLSSKRERHLLELF